MSDSVFQGEKSLTWLKARTRQYGEHADYYPTPPYATRVLTDWINEGQHMPASVKQVVEPGAGEGHMVDVLEKELGLPVVASDLHDRGQPDIKVVDFITNSAELPLKGNAVITNPPFALTREFALTALEGGAALVAMLANVSILGGQKRHETLFKPYPLFRLLVIPERVAYAPGKVVEQGAGKAPFTSVWLVWIPEQPSEWRTEFRSLNRKEDTLL